MPKITGSDEDMIREGWSKQLIYGYVFETQGKCIYQPYDFDATAMPCLNCGTADFAWVRVMPSGVFWRCGNCNVTTGPLSTGPKGRGKLREDEVKQISPKEALKIMSETGQVPSASLIKKVRRETRRPRKKLTPETKRIGTLKKKKALKA